MIIIACGCGKKSGTPSLGWTVDLTGKAKNFSDGSIKKTFATVGEANIEIAKLGLGGKVRPRPAVSGEKP